MAGPLPVSAGGPAERRAGRLRSRIRKGRRVAAAGARPPVGRPANRGKRERQRSKDQAARRRMERCRRSRPRPRRPGSSSRAKQPRKVAPAGARADAGNDMQVGRPHGRNARTGGLREQARSVARKAPARKSTSRWRQRRPPSVPKRRVDDKAAGGVDAGGDVGFARCTAKAMERPSSEIA